MDCLLNFYIEIVEKKFEKNAENEDNKKQVNHGGN